MVVPVTVALIVKDEEARLPEALASAAWAEEVLVVDTGSSDATIERARAAGARVEEIPWRGFVDARNRALALARCDWVLMLDADERVPPDLAGEIAAAVSRPGPVAYRMPRLSHLLGQPIRHGTWFPDRQLRLGRRSAGFRAEGGRVHEALLADGPAGLLSAPLLHFPYATVADLLRKARLYARLKAADRFERGERAGSVDLLVRPLWELFRCYVLKRGFLDGKAGCAVAFFHAWSYFLTAAFLAETARGAGAPPRPPVRG